MSSVKWNKAVPYDVYYVGVYYDKDLSEYRVVDIDGNWFVDGKGQMLCAASAKMETSLEHIAHTNKTDAVLIGVQLDTFTGAGPEWHCWAVKTITN